MEFTVRISRFHLAALIFILIVLAGIGYTTATQAEGFYHDAADIVGAVAEAVHAQTADSAAAADSVDWADVQNKPSMYPTEIKETSGDHNGGFGNRQDEDGYRQMYQWIDSHGCPHSDGWHVCAGWEVAYLYQTTSAPCGNGDCQGWYIQTNNDNTRGDYDYVLTECHGWTNYNSKIFGNAWINNRPSTFHCGNELEVLCCR